MWRLLSIKSKLLILLVTVQAIVLSLGFWALLQWMTSERMNDLYHQLDNQSDALEDLIVIENGEWVYRRSSEVKREIYSDPSFYFALQNNTRQTVLFSEGQPEKIRQQLDERLSHISLEDDAATPLTLEDKKWIFQRADIQRTKHGESVTAALYVGFNINTAFEEIELLRRLAVTIIIFALLLTATGSYLVVNYSIGNLRKFSHSIRELQPPFFLGRVIMTPQSAEEKLLFDSYETMIKAIRTSTDSQRLFIANASHELKTPIAAALSAIEVTLSKPRTVDDYKNTCQDVLAELQVLRRLSNGLLDLARLDDTMIQKNKCDLADALELVIQRWSKTANEKSIQIHCKIVTEKIKPVPGTVEMWEVIVGNLVDNAIKYGKKGGNVLINLCENPSGYLELSIADDGIGMAQAEIDQLGKVFFRADQARSGIHSFGLGFAHAKKLLENLGGILTVKKNEFGGIHIVISLSYLA